MAEVELDSLDDKFVDAGGLVRGVPTVDLVAEFGREIKVQGVAFASYFLLDVVVDVSFLLGAVALFAKVTAVFMTPSRNARTAGVCAWLVDWSAPCLYPAGFLFYTKERMEIR